jgi:hypothetical protein
MKPSLFSFGVRSTLGLTALGFALIGATGCGASAQYEALGGDDAARSAHEARTVDVRTTAPGNARAHKEVGVVTASTANTDNFTERDFARALRDTAAAKGCDALVVSDGSASHPGAFAAVDSDKPFHKGVCVVYTDGKGADQDSLASSNAWLDGNAPREQAVTLSSDPPPSNCTNIGTIHTDVSQPTEGAKRALFRRRAREQKANYVQLSGSSLNGGGEAAAYSCPAPVVAGATLPKEG